MGSTVPQLSGSSGAPGIGQKDEIGLGWTMGVRVRHLRQAGL
jgi:hypothetical protein